MERTKGVVMDSDSLMVSFDMKVLYTSLPVDRTIEIGKRRLADERSWQERTTLAEDVIELLKTCLEAMYFTFRGNFFHLTDGVAMGSPVSSIVANLFMENYEENALKEAGELRPQVWDGYVDDVFSICKKKNVERFLQYLNS